MGIQEKADDGAFQPRAQAFVEVETRTGHLGSGFGVQNTELRAQIPVCLRLKIKLGRLAPMAHILIFLVILAIGHTFVRNIRDGQHNVALLGFQRADLHIQYLYLIRQLLHFLHDRGDIAALFLDLRNLLARLVLLRFQRIRLAAQLAALGVDRENTIHLGIHILVAAAHRSLDAIRFGTNNFNIQHDKFSLSFVFF